MVQTTLRCGIFVFCLLSLPQNKRKIYNWGNNHRFNFSTYRTFSVLPGNSIFSTTLLPTKERLLSHQSKKLKDNYKLQHLVCLFFHPLQLHASHCSYLDIHISQKIRLCEDDFEGKFQTSVQASIMNFLIWKFRFIILIFLLFLAGVVKSTAFCTQLLLFLTAWNVRVTFLYQIAT